jgi:hypothetical protein
MERSMLLLSVITETDEDTTYTNEVGLLFPFNEFDWVGRLNMFPESTLFVFKDKASESYTPKVCSVSREGIKHWNPVGKMHKVLDSQDHQFIMRLHMFPGLTIYAAEVLDAR